MVAAGLAASVLRVSLRMKVFTLVSPAVLQVRPVTCGVLTGRPAIA
jgi:hypothetical protein